MGEVLRKEVMCVSRELSEVKASSRVSWMLGCRGFFSVWEMPGRTRSSPITLPQHPTTSSNLIFSFISEFLMTMSSGLLTPKLLCACSKSLR